MGKRPAETESFEGLSVMQWTRGPCKEENRLSWTGLELQPKLVVSRRWLPLGAEFGGRAHLAKVVLNRRSQRSSMPWTRFLRLLAR